MKPNTFWSDHVLHADDISTSSVVGEGAIPTTEFAKEVSEIIDAMATFEVVGEGAEALLPCPFCKSIKVENWASRPPNKDYDIWCVFCHDCNCEGPEALTEAEAQRSWNRRLTSSAVEGLVAALQVVLNDHDERAALVSFEQTECFCNYCLTVRAHLKELK